MSICAKIVFLQNCRDVQKEALQKRIVFIVFLFYAAARETEKEKTKWQKAKKTIKMVFSEVVIQK